MARVTEGVGVMYSPHAVFYGRGDDPGQTWSSAFPNGYCDDGKPLLLSLVESQRIKDVAFGLISNGATPDREYRHELYACPNCNRLANRFYFKLSIPTGQYEPDYTWSNCGKQLLRVQLKLGHDDQAEIVYIPMCIGNVLNAAARISYTESTLTWIELFQERILLREN